ncbi:hypothetical protein [Micromonospora sp. LOL_023]|uniref:hypothetical protein n=1 Tax=Micromonospora sp. LOL_023 TaxID=3345418 RepID=UPI003A839486
MSSAGGGGSRPTTPTGSLRALGEEDGDLADRPAQPPASGGANPAARTRLTGASEAVRLPILVRTSAERAGGDG